MDENSKKAGTAYNKDCDENHNKTAYLDVLRVFACLLILTAHVAAAGIDSFPIPSFDFLMANAWDNLGVIGVPLFIMISGSLLLNPDYSISFKCLFSKLFKLIVVYFITLVFYNLMNCHQEGYGYSLASLKTNVLLNSLLGRGMYHLWFMPMLMGLYLLVPILKKISADRQVCLYFLSVYFVMIIFFPTVLRFHFRFDTIVRSLSERIYISPFTGYVGYFLLGHYLNYFARPLRKKEMLVTALTGFLFFNAGHLLCYRDSIAAGSLSVLFNDPFTVNDWLVAICIFLLIKNIPAARMPAGICKKLSKYVFGIYLIHPAFLMIAAWCGFRTASFMPAVTIPLCVAGLFGLCLGVVHSTKMIFAALSPKKPSK